MTEWSTLAGMRARLRKKWDTGAVLAEHARGGGFARIDLPIRGPTSAELGSRYAEVAGWVREWASGDGQFTISTKVIGARRTGANTIPDRFRIDSFDDLTRFLGTTAEALRHRELVDLADHVAAPLRTWVVDKPMRALAHEAEFDRLLACVYWLMANTDRNRYLRHIDVPGVDTKFVERHRGILSELLDLVIDQPVDPASRDFTRRYGFLDKPSRVRLRVLDPMASEFPAGITDVELRADEFASQLFDVERVFLIENEVTCLAFPLVPRSLLIFGGGYAVARVSRLAWLRHLQLYYWGDIDTHGFRMLDLVRSRFPDARSMLMDRATLLAHELHWDREPAPVNIHLPHLTREEAALYRDLVEETFGAAVRLEQERVSYPLIEAALRDLP